jgi:hypothetical protein
MKILDVGTNVVENVGELAFRYQQEIPEDFVSNLKKQKIESTQVREKDFMHVAAVPVAIHLAWLKEGYDMTREPYKETLKRLHARGLDAFIVTNKRV